MKTAICTWSKRTADCTSLLNKDSRRSYSLVTFFKEARNSLIVLMMWFALSFVGTLVLLPLHYVSVEHQKLEQRYGSQRGKKIGSVLGLISGWGYFIFLFGLWFSPQPRFHLPVFMDLRLFIPVISIETSVLNIILGLMFLLLGGWLGLRGVLDLGLEVSETHRPKELVTTGIYGIIRHPQYLGAILSHVGMSLILSAQYSVLVIPILTIRDYLLCKKEDSELAKEFGREYEDYQDRVPMFLPSRNSP